MSVKRCCGNCGGPVYLAVQRSKVEKPLIDERGFPVTELHTDPITGQVYEKEKTISLDVRGLGTWKCTKNCLPKGRTVRVLTYAGAGKEMEKLPRTSPPNFKGMAIRDPYLVAVERRRPIPVVTKGASHA